MRFLRAPGYGGEFDLCRRQIGGFALNFDILDLPGIVIAVEGNGNDGYAGGGKRVEQDGFVGRQDRLGAFSVRALFGKPALRIEGRYGCGIFVGHDGSPK